MVAPTPFFSVRGTPLALKALLETLTAQGHAVDLLTFPIGDDVDLPGVRIVRCGRWTGIRRIGLGVSGRKLALDIAMFLHLLGLTVATGFRLGRRYDVVHTLDEMTFAAWLLRPFLGCPVVYDMDSSIEEQFEGGGRWRFLTPLAGWLERRMLNVADVVAPVCEALAERVQAKAGQGADARLVILHDLAQIEPEHVDAAPPPPSPHESLADLPRPIFMYVGNFASYQGLDLLLDAFERLGPERADTRGSLVVVGGQPDEVDAARRDHPDVTFTGAMPLSALPSLYRLADVLVSPRRSGNNTPMKIYDYLAAGRAILATDLRTHTQVLDETCAVLAPPSAPGVAAAMVRLVDDPGWGRRLGEVARQTWRRDYGPEAFRAKVARLYHLATADLPRGEDQPETTPASRSTRRASPTDPSSADPPSHGMSEPRA